MKGITSLDVETTQATADHIRHVLSEHLLFLTPITTRTRIINVNVICNVNYCKKESTYICF